MRPTRSRAVTFSPLLGSRPHPDWVAAELARTRALAAKRETTSFNPLAIFISGRKAKVFSGKQIRVGIVFSELPPSEPIVFWTIGTLDHLEPYAVLFGDRVIDLLALGRLGLTSL